MKKPVCSVCGAELAPGSRDQTCPRCLLELALKDPTSDSAERTADTSNPPRALPERIGSYRILELLGEGGMGQVYLAEDTSLERQVALKFLPPEMQADETARKRFQREAKSAAALDHPFICHIHEIGEADGQGFIAMEYVEGETLRDKLVSGPMPLQQALQVASEIAEALEKAHQSGIVHRDLKPSNIMLTPEGHVKVMDFGLAKRMVSDSAGAQENQLTTLTKEGSTVGTIPYMSPEQLKGQKVDTRSDIFSFGIILYELLAGVHPFLRAEAMETAGAILTQHPPPLSRYREGIPEILQHTVKKMLAKEPDQRYQSIHEVKTNLSELYEDSLGGSRPEEAPPIQKRVLRLGWPLRAAVVLVPAFALMALAMWWSSQGLTPTTEASSVVALPCQLFGLDEEDSYLTNAVSHSISTLLGQLEGLETKAPVTDIEFDSIGRNPQKIAEIYNVGALLQCQMTAEENRWTLNLQLVEPSTRTQLWSRQYDEGNRDNYNLLMFQAAEGIGQALKPTSQAVSSMAGLAASSEAELAFQKGRHYSNRYNNRKDPLDFDLAFQAFEHVLELDPERAEAAAEIAFLYRFQFEAGVVSAQDTAAQINLWAERALQINRRCGKAYSALSIAEAMNASPSWKSFLSSALKAAYFDRRDSMAHMGVAQAISDNSKTLALEAVRQSGLSDPSYIYALHGESFSLWSLGRSQLALDVINVALDREPEFAWGLANAVRYLAYLGRFAEASVMLEKLDAQVQQGRYPRIHQAATQLGLALKQGEKQDVEGLIKEVLAAVDDPLTPANEIKTIATELIPFLVEGDRLDEAFRILQVLLERGTAPAYDWLRLNPHLELLRRDPRFEAILSPSRAQFDEMLAILDEARSSGEFPQYLERPLADLLLQLGIQRN